VADAEQVKAGFKHVIEKFGRLDILVNNAAITRDGLAMRMKQDDWEAVIRTNLTGAHLCIQQALHTMIRARAGRIINIASKVAMTGQGGTSGYAAAKGAILALTREWAAELLPYGIRVNALLPAEVMTPLYKQWLGTFPDPEGKLKHITAKIPLGKRMTEPDEIAAMVLFLMSAQAGHVTGQHVLVDGGYVHLDRALT